ncbi:MAG: hypothetical protein ACP5KN_08630 [Armatimonadota bacterium]
MMRMTVAVTMAVVVIIAMGTAHAETCYLSPQGDDAGDGSRDRPWRTLAKVNETLQPGDTVVLLDGEHEGVIEPATSGEEGAPITYRSENPLRAVLRGGEASNGETACVYLPERSHIVIEGFQMLPERGRWMVLEGAEHCTVADCTMEEGEGWGAATCNDCRYNRYLRNRVLRLRSINEWGHIGGNMWNNQGCSHCVFEGNYFSRAGHCPLHIWFDCEYMVLRGNVFDCRWGRNFEFFSAPLMLVEGNVITNGFDGSGSADGRAKLFIIDSIFRRNLIFRNWYMPLVINAYQRPGHPEADPFSMARSRLYHNTWYRNHDGGFQLSDYGGESRREHWVYDNTFANNIFFDNDPGGGHTALLIRDDIGRDNRWLSNLLCGDRPGRATIRVYDTYARATEWPGEPWTVDEAHRQRPGQFAGNVDADPEFVDAEADDYRLREGSPAIDAGRPLTRTAAGGSGRLMPVEDARYFYDGFGIPGEQGDLIVVGDGRAQARVVGRDLEANMLALDRDLTWREGDPVGLPYAGSAPDLGAFEMGAEGEEWYLAPRVPEGLRLPTMETATEPVVAVGFEEERREDWHYYWNFSRQRNTNSRLDETTAASGQRSMRVYADADGAIMACDIRPRWWDIDRFPYARFAYRIPEGVPVGILLYPFTSDEWGLGAVCVGGSPARDPGGYPHVPRWELTDDDRWHEVTIDARAIREVHPGVKLLKMLRFWTNGNGSEGDQFWFDDFTILPAEDLE